MARITYPINMFLILIGLHWFLYIEWVLQSWEKSHLGKSNLVYSCYILFASIWLKILGSIQKENWSVIFFFWMFFVSGISQEWVVPFSLSFGRVCEELAFFRILFFSSLVEFIRKVKKAWIFNLFFVSFMSTNLIYLF